MLALVGGAICSEVAVDLYTTRILKADVTVVDHGVCWASPMRYVAARYPRRVRTRVSAGTARGYVFGVCELMPNVWAVLFFTFQARKKLSIRLSFASRCDPTNTSIGRARISRKITSRKRYQISNIDGMSKRAQWFAADPSAAWRRSAGGRVRSPCCLLEGEVRPMRHPIRSRHSWMARMSTRRAIRDRPCLPLQVPPVGPSNRSWSPYQDTDLQDTLFASSRLSLCHLSTT